MVTWFCRPVRLKSSSIKSSETSAKYSWPRREQKEAIHDSGVPDEVDMLTRRYWRYPARGLSETGIAC